MKYAIAILSLICAVLLVWLVHVKLQIHSVSRQLEKRLTDHTRNSVSITLADPGAMRMAAVINRCLDEEETTKLTLERQEKDFRATIANISHDLRTPLTSVKGYLQLLAATPLNELQQQRMAVIRRHVNELGDLIEHFFEYSFLLSDENELIYESFSLTDEVTECLAAAVPQFEEKGMEVHLESFPQVGIIADREKTVRIIQNLIRNCLQHSAGDISVNITRSDHAVQVAFSNPVKDAAHIEMANLFDRFYTSDKTRKKSTGLGLPIVKLLTERMHGHTFARLDGNIITIGVELPLTHTTSE